MDLQGIWHLWNDGVLRGAQHVFFKMMYSLRPWNFNADAHHVYKMTRRTITSWNFSPSSIVQLRDQLRSGPCIRPLHSTRSCPCNPLHSKMIKDESTWINQRLSCMFSSYLIISHLRTSSYVIISAMCKFECSHLASQIGSQKSTFEMISCKVEMPAAPPKLSTTLCAHCSRTLPGSGWRSTCTGKMPALGQWSLGTCSPWYSWWWQRWPSKAGLESKCARSNSAAFTPQAGG